MLKDGTSVQKIYWKILRSLLKRDEGPPAQLHAQESELSLKWHRWLKQVILLGVIVVSSMLRIVGFSRLLYCVRHNDMQMTFSGIVQPK